MDDLSDSCDGVIGRITRITGDGSLVDSSIVASSVGDGGRVGSTHVNNEGTVQVGLVPSEDLGQTTSVVVSIGRVSSITSNVSLIWGTEVTSSVCDGSNWGIKNTHVGH